MKIDGKEKNVLPVSTAEYNPCGARSWLNGTTLTLGLQNVFDSDPPFVAGATNEASPRRRPCATNRGDLAAKGGLQSHGVALAEALS